MSDGYFGQTGERTNYKAPGAGVASVTDVTSVLSEDIEAARRTKFYELEAAEVLDIIFSEDDLKKNKLNTDERKPKFSFIGAVKVRKVYSQQGKDEKECLWAKPIEPNIKQIPEVGEFVIVGNYLKQLYYKQKINLLGSVNNNIWPGRSNIGGLGSNGQSNTEGSVETSATGTPGQDKKKTEFNIAPTWDIRQLEPAPGDTIINGRFGQSIRFGSADPKGEEPSPNILLRVGQLTDASKFEKQDIVDDLVETPNKPVNEDIDADGSSLWMTTDEEVDLGFAATDGFTTEVPVLDGKQIILNSDRIVFNAKNDGELYCFAGKNINLISNTSAVIETAEIYLGSPDASEPIVKGQVLHDLLVELIDAINGIHTIPTPAGPTGPLNASQTTGGVLGTSLAKIKGKVKDILSAQNYTI